MSSLHTKTKKVTAYGRNKSRIISLYSDWVPEIDGVTPSDQQRTPLKTAPTSRATPIKRAPLQTKASQNDCRLVALSQTPAKGGKGKDKAVVVEEKPVKKAVGRPRKAVAPISMMRLREDTPLLSALPSAGLRGEVIQRQQAAAPMTQTLLEADVDTVVEQVETLTIQESHQESQIQPLDVLLAACSQPAPLPFADLFTSTGGISSILSTVSSQSSGPPPPATIKGIRGRVIRPQIINDLQVRKIGEASFSEVYGVSSKGTVELVMKVVPLLPPVRTLQEEAAPDEPDASEPADVLKELEITKAVSEVGAGFVRYHGCFIVDGPYPEVLLDCWDDFKWAKSTSSYRPSNLPAAQQYAVLVLSNEGVDLESFKFDATTGWTQALAVFQQISSALAEAEHALEFEHRDLHAGQIMISFEPSTSAVKATMIDFGLSRMRQVWSAPPNDVFDGVGAQWDVYRAMRQHIGDDWAGYHPVTNVLWLRHVLNVMLHSTKSLRKPRAPAVPLANGNVHASPMRTRRVGAAVKRSPAGPDPSEVEAWQRLVALEAALAGGKVASAHQVSKL